jgi:hypothetical protein
MSRVAKHERPPRNSLCKPLAPRKRQEEKCLPSNIKWKDFLAGEPSFKVLSKCHSVLFALSSFFHASIFQPNPKRKQKEEKKEFLSIVFSLTRRRFWLATHKNPK